MVLGGLAAAARFLPTAWRGVWSALGLACVAIALAFWQGGPGLWLLALTSALIVRGGLWRLVTTQAGRGSGGLQVRGLEARLAASWILAAVFLAILILLALVILLVGAYAVASAGRGFDPEKVATWAPAIGGPGRILLGAVALLCLFGLAYAAARLSLFEAATAHRNKVQALSSWTLTRRTWLGLLTAQLILASPVIVACWMGVGAGNLGRSVAAGVLIGGLWLPMSVGLMAYAWDECAPRP